jgi:ubiquinone/menaquinone biosynthesis C-methylase UbiE
MSTSHAAFAGTIPAIYDACLGPLLFEFSADDLAGRVAGHVCEGRVLELACGTGILTQFLRRALPPAVEILATDLNPGMLDYARAHRDGMLGVHYEQADALELPYEDASCDAVICQFGIMFFPDLAKGIAEMLRVLRPGGLVACNVWDALEANPVAGLAHETIARHFDADPPRFLQVPFGSCSYDATLAAFQEAGFESVHGEVVEATIERPSALEVAKGFVEGNPGVLEIRERASASPEQIVEELAHAIEAANGPPPLRFPLREFVFTGTAPRA